jgi:hypothetical protein
MKPEGAAITRLNLVLHFCGEDRRITAVASLARAEACKRYPVRANKPSAVPSEDAEKIFALVSGRRRSSDIRKAYRVLRAIFDKAF